MGDVRRARLRAVGTLICALTMSAAAVVAGPTAAPAQAACLVGVTTSSNTTVSSSSQLVATNYARARLVRVTRKMAKARGRVHRKYVVTATATTTLGVTACVAGLQVPVTVSTSRTVASEQWAWGDQVRVGYGPTRRAVARGAALEAATSQAHQGGDARGREQASTASYVGALVQGVLQGLLPSASTYQSAVARAWTTVANDVRANHGKQPVRFVGAFTPLATDWARTIHGDYVTRLGNGTVHDRSFYGDLNVGGCTGGYTAGEIIAQVWEYDDPWRTAVAARDAWLNSPSHRAVLLDGRYTLGGLGIQSGSNRVTMVGRFRTGACTGVA
jgi:uncharacterized protein YkwD